MNHGMAGAPVSAQARNLASSACTCPPQQAFDRQAFRATRHARRGRRPPAAGWREHHPAGLRQQPSEQPVFARRRRCPPEPVRERCMAEEIEVPRIRVIVETETRRRHRRPAASSSLDRFARWRAARPDGPRLGRLDPCEHARVMRDERGKDDEETDGRSNRENGMRSEAPPEKRHWREKRRQAQRDSTTPRAAGGVAAAGPRLNPAGVPLRGVMPALSPRCSVANSRA